MIETWKQQNMSVNTTQSVSLNKDDDYSPGDKTNKNGISTQASVVTTKQETAFKQEQLKETNNTLTRTDKTLQVDTSKHLTTTNQTPDKTSETSVHANI